MSGRTGVAVHSASFDHDEDMASLLFVFEGILRSLSDGRGADAAKYMGVLAHFVEDSLSPPHSGKGAEDVHGVIERSVPPFTLAGRPPRLLAEHMLEAAEAILVRCYAAAEQNRKDMPAMVKAAKAGDEKSLDIYRLRGGAGGGGVAGRFVLHAADDGWPVNHAASGGLCSGNSGKQ